MLPKEAQKKLQRYLVLDNGCWEYSGARDIDGYGLFPLKFDGVYKQMRAHRVSYEYKHGSIPKGMFVCHSCDNPSCINPDHLFLGTPKDNMVDKSMKGRASRFPGEKNQAAKLTDKQRGEIFELREKGLTYSQIAKMYSIAFQTVGKIVNGARYGIS